jgi:hypothetical protein
MQGAEIDRVRGGAPVTKIIEIVADRLIRDDETDRFPASLLRQKAVGGSSFTVKGLCPYTEQCLPSEFRVLDLSRSLPPPVKTAMDLGENCEIAPGHHGTGRGGNPHGCRLLSKGNGERAVIGIGKREMGVKKKGR